MIETNATDIDVEGFGRFWDIAVALKSVARQGWVDRGVLSPESVADHSWGVALLAWLAARDRDDLDRERVLLLGLVHDLPEAVTGDATPFDFARGRDGRIPRECFAELPVYSDDARRGKRDAEARALAELTAALPADLAGDIRSAWEEYDEQQTAEARFVKQIDKLETLLQSRVYKAAQPELVMDSFALGADRDVRDLKLRRIGRLSGPEPTQ